MTLRRRLAAPLLLLLGAHPGFGLHVSDAARGSLPHAGPAGKRRALPAGSSDHGKLPLAFEPNQGQADRDVAFVARGKGFSLLLTSQEAVLVLARPAPREAPHAEPGDPPSRRLPPRHSDASRPPAVVRLKLGGGTGAREVVGCDRLPSVSHYLLGNDPAAWHTGVPNYRRVEYRGLHDGIDVAFHGDGRVFEYDFLLAPGADPESIRLGFEGALGPRLDAQGNLILEVDGSEILQEAPVTYQETAAGAREPVRASYVIAADCTVGFILAGYDRSRPLVIDPTLVYSTFLGTDERGEDYGNDIALDGDGNAYVTGYTRSIGFPLVNPLQAVNAGGTNDAFVVKLDPTGATLLYSTYLGGSGKDYGQGIAVDAAGSAHVTGLTDSPDFPTASPFQAASAGASDAFVTKLNPAGSALVYSTYLGGSGSTLYGGDVGFDIAVDRAGNAYVTGTTDSTDFPTANPVQAAYAGSQDAFVAKLNPAGSALVYSTYLGGSVLEYGLGIAADAAGNAYVTGDTDSPDFPTASPLQAGGGGGQWDAFVTKLSPTGSFAYSTYLGGNRCCYDVGNGIAVDGAGNAYVTGYTNTTNFPTRNPLQAVLGGDYDGFVFKLNPAGSALVYSTYLGGRDVDGGTGIAADDAGNAYVSGVTASTNFPTANPLQAAHAGARDAFVAKLSPAGSSLAYSTYLGGSDTEGAYGIAVDAAGNAYVAGVTDSADFPTANPFQPAYAGDGDAFVSRLNTAGSALVYSTYLGGNGGDDHGGGVAVDAAGSAYITGSTNARTFLTLDPLQAASAGRVDAFVAKLDPPGSALVYSTYLGGSGNDHGTAIAVDGAGNAFVTGDTDSSDFPALNPLQAAGAGKTDAFVAELNAAGSAFIYSTYLGGSGVDLARGIAVDAAGSACVVGRTDSTDFPTASPLQAVHGGGPDDAFVARLAPAGTSLEYSTYLGGSGDDTADGVALDTAGSACVTGATDSPDFPTSSPLQATYGGGSSDAFVAKLDPAGSSLAYSTFLGGAAGDRGSGIAVDAAGSCHVTGDTGSPDFPTRSPLQGAFGGGSSDAFVSSLSPAGSTLVYSTYLGGSGDDHGAGIAVDGAGYASVTGDTTSTDFPTLVPIQVASGGAADAFVAKLNPRGSQLVYSTYLGGAADDRARSIAVDGAGYAYLAGDTSSTGFPVLGGIDPTNNGDPDAFVAKIAPCSGGGPLPGRVAALRGSKSRPASVRFSWDAEPLSAGYHLHAVEAKGLIPTANAAGNPVCVAPAGRTDCTHAGALPPPRSTLFYQVVGACSDGSSEGPI